MNVEDQNNINNSSKVSPQEQPVIDDQENSGDNQMVIDQTMDTEPQEIPREFKAVEHKEKELKDEEFDASVYYRQGQLHGEQKEQGEYSYSQDGNRPQDERRPSLFTQSMRALNLPKISSKEEARKVFFGQNNLFYERYYKRFREQKKKVSWNWAAFFLNVYWFFSRKMYAYGLLSMVCKGMLTIVGVSLYDNMANDSLNSLLIPWAVIYLLVDIGIGMFANYLYISHMESKIVYPGETELSGDDLAKVIVARGGFTLSGVFLCFLLYDVVLYALQYFMGML